MKHQVQFIETDRSDKRRHAAAHGLSPARHPQMISVVVAFMGQGSDLGLTVLCSSLECETWGGYLEIE